MDIVVEGRVYLQGRLQKACVGIEEGSIVEIRKVLKGDVHHDFGESLVLPGGIDPHVHFREPGSTNKEDFNTGSMSALFGGVTCVLDMPNTIPPANDRLVLADKAAIVSGRSWVDYGLFAGLSPRSKVQEMAELCSGYKMFMGSSTQSVLVTGEGDIGRIMDEVSATGKVLSVHAEEQSLIGDMVEKGLRDHQRNRDAEVEVTAIRRLLSHKRTGKLNICHVSSRFSLPLLKGEGLSFEATPHHMLLDASMDIGAEGKVNPPLRGREDREALFDAFRQGKVPILASDHAPHAPEEKATEFAMAPSGLPGVETSIPMFMALVKRGFLELGTLISASSETPARVFGLNKGGIEVGKDADLAIYDPRDVTTIKGGKLHSKCGWTPYEGREAIFPRAAMLRGELLMEDGGLSGKRMGRNIVNDPK